MNNYMYSDKVKISVKSNIEYRAIYIINGVHIDLIERKQKCNEQRKM